MAENKNQSRRSFPSVGIEGTSSSGLDRNFRRVNVDREDWKVQADALKLLAYSDVIGTQERFLDINKKIATLESELKAGSITRRENLMQMRQNNLNRMAQLYGDYYQQFGGTLNEGALNFLDYWARVKVPTFTSIMAGYEHARASHADRALMALQQQQKLIESAEAIGKERAALQDEREANTRAVELATLGQEAKYAQAEHEGKKAFIDQSREDNLIYYGAGGKRPSGGGGAGGWGGSWNGAGAMSFDGGPDVPTQNVDPRQTSAYVPRSVVEGSTEEQAQEQARQALEERGQQLQAMSVPGERYQQYLDSGAGSFWQNPVRNAWNWMSTPSNLYNAVVGGSIAGQYLPATASKVAGFFGRVTGATGAAATGATGATGAAATGATGATGAAATGAGGLLRNVGRFMLRGAIPRPKGVAGAIALGAATLPLQTDLMGNTFGTIGAARQWAANAWDDVVTGNYRRSVQEALQSGQPVPQRRSPGDVYRDINQRWDRFTGHHENYRETNQFINMYRNIYGHEPSNDMIDQFDSQTDAVRYGMFEDILGGKAPKNEDDFGNLFVENAKRYSDLQEQFEAQKRAFEKGEWRKQTEQAQTVSPVTNRPEIFDALDEAWLTKLRSAGYNDLELADLPPMWDDHISNLVMMESGNTPGKISNIAHSTKGHAYSRYQLQNETFDELRKGLLRDFGDKLRPDQRDRLRKAQTANDLDNDGYQDLLRAMVIYRGLVDENNNRNIGGESGKNRLNITTTQMFGDLARMKKRSGGHDDPYYWGNQTTAYWTNWGRFGQDELQRNIARVNKRVAEDFGFGYLRDNKGNNLDWLNGDWYDANNVHNYRLMLARDYGEPYMEQEMIPRQEALRAMGREGVSSYLRAKDKTVRISELNPDVLERANAMAEFVGETTQGKGRITLTSAKRTREEQAALYENRKKNPNKVAKPGHSKHEVGNAFDMRVEELEALVKQYPALGKNVDELLARFGLYRPDIKGDPVHVEVIKK